jgi:TolA-binding protein
MALVITEIQGLENLFAATPDTAPDRVQIVRRLAEDYVELERANPGTAGSSLRAGAASTKAVRYYTLVRDQYPQYPQLDEVLYDLGYEYEIRGDLPNARRLYYDLIVKAPSSRYVSHAYFAFGEMFLAEAATDPTKAGMARQAYEKVLQFPQTPLRGEAQLRIGKSLELAGDRIRATEAYRKVLRDYPNSDAASAVPSWAKTP